MKIDTSSYYPKSPLDDDPEFADTSNNEETISVDSVNDTCDIIAPEPSAVSEIKQREDITITAEEERHPNKFVSLLNEFADEVSHILSMALVPLLMPVYGTLLAFNLTVLSYTPSNVKLVFVLIVALINVLVPAVVILVLKSMGLVKDVGLNDRKERFIPYGISVICLIATALFFSYKGSPEWLVMFFVGGAVAGIIEMIVNIWWKISVHSAGIAGLTALMVYIYTCLFCLPETQTWLLLVIGLTGLLGSARIWLGRHTLAQVLAGYAVGFSSIFLTMLL